MAKLTWNDVEEKLENLGFKVSDWQSNGNSYSCEIQKYSPAGQDCNFILQCEKDNPASVSQAFAELYENYDPDEETMLWVDSSGHGKKGDQFWEEAVDHAVNSGGELWQSSAERVELMEKAGLIVNNYEDSSLNAAYYNAYKSYMKVYGTPGDTVTFGEFVSDIFPNKNDMTEYLQADKKLLNKYKNFDEDKTNALIDKYIDKADKMWGKYMHSYLKDLDVLDNKARDRKIADYEKKHDVSHGR